MVGRMCIRQAGVTTMARITASNNFVTYSGTVCTCSLTEVTATSKADSQLKPIKMARARISARMASSMSLPVDSRSWILSRMKITRNARTVTKTAITTCFSMPVRCLNMPETDQMTLKRVHQAKLIARMLLVCGATRKQRDRVQPILVRRRTAMAKARPVNQRSRQSFVEWPFRSSSSSSPASMGSTPLMQKRRHCTSRKETASPTTSSSASSAMSSQTWSASSPFVSRWTNDRTPNDSLFRARSMTQQPSAVAPSAAARAAPCRLLARTICSRTKKLMAAKPAM
mmetsp:Transcript_29017/g.63832  ORF Transcript_29017/g.63832 Transcript_29017/m.63832 type:complete len:285 (+) Transcript_29017:125-979(+)